MSTIYIYDNICFGLYKWRIDILLLLTELIE